MWPRTKERKSLSKMRKVKFQVVYTGAPYPAEAWWRIIGSNGRIIVSSEIMGRKHAHAIVNRMIHAIQSNRFTVEEIKTYR